MQILRDVESIDLAKLFTPRSGSIAHCRSCLAVCSIDFASKVSAGPKKPSLTPLHCNGGGGVILRVIGGAGSGSGSDDGGNGGGNNGGSGFNTMPPKPLEGDFLFSPLFFGLPTLRGDALFGASFSSEQSEAPPPP